MKTLRSSYVWGYLYSDRHTVLDPDGWDRRHGGAAFKRSMLQPIDETEYCNRVAASTVKYHGDSPMSLVRRAFSLILGGLKRITGGGHG